MKIARYNMKEFIEKLIGRLEEKAIEHRETGFEMERKGFSNIADKQYAKQTAYLNAIEIVNQLAGEYNNDLCEWEKGSSGYVGYPAYYSRCCTTNSKGLEMQTHIISDWKFCPYCGKKIKVVE